MFHDLELEEECTEIIDKSPCVADRNLTRGNNTPKKFQWEPKF